MLMSVIYLTAHTDTTTVQRLKKTAPYGLLIKPVSESELYSTIETALYRHKRYSITVEHEKIPRSLRAIARRHYIRDTDGIIVDANQSMLDMVGYSRRELLERISAKHYDRDMYAFITGNC